MQMCIRDSGGDIAQDDSRVGDGGQAPGHGGPRIGVEGIAGLQVVGGLYRTGHGVQNHGVMCIRDRSF